VVLSFGLPFAVIPLLLFARRRDIMGDLVNGRWTTLATFVVAGLIVALNVYLLVQTLF
jgi:manganese transport protein